MSAFNTATRLFHACEGLQGWEGCREFAHPDASFEAQSEPLAAIDTLQGYCDWMAGLGNGPMPGCRYDLHSAAWDEDSRTALFFATFHGTHSGDGGPVPATGQSTASHYVYAIKVAGDGKVSHMTKIWNAPWAMRELGWG
jgi:hypothetical protein